MGELATVQDAIDLGFEVVYGNSYYELCTSGGVDRIYILSPESDVYFPNEFITKAAFRSSPVFDTRQTGVCPSGVNGPELMTERSSGIYPTPVTLSGYGTNEFIEKTALVYPLNPADLYVMHWTTMGSAPTVAVNEPASGITTYSVNSGQNLVNLSRTSNNPFISSPGTISFTLTVRLGLSKYASPGDNYERNIMIPGSSVHSVNLNTSVGTPSYTQQVYHYDHYITIVIVGSIYYGSSGESFYLYGNFMVNFNTIYGYKNNIKIYL